MPQAHLWQLPRLSTGHAPLFVHDPPPFLHRCYRWPDLDLDPGSGWSLELASPRPDVVEGGRCLLPSERESEYVLAVDLSRCHFHGCSLRSLFLERLRRGMWRKDRREAGARIGRAQRSVGSAHRAVQAFAALPSQGPSVGSCRWSPWAVVVGTEEVAMLGYCPWRMGWLLLRYLSFEVGENACPFAMEGNE